MCCSWFSFGQQTAKNKIAFPFYQTAACVIITDLKSIRIGNVSVPRTHHILRRIPTETAAIIIMVIALGLAALSGALMKILTETMSPPLVSWFRFVGYAALLVPLALWRVGPACFRPARVLVQVARGLMLAAGNVAFLYGVRHVDYANAISILYIYPFIMVALSVWVLDEHVSKSAWLGVAGGFLGVLLVVRPDLAGIDSDAMFILFTGLMVALQMLFNRKLGVLSDPVVVSLWGALAAAAALTISVPFVWEVPSASQMLLIGGLAVLTALSQTLMITVMSMAPAEKVAPFTYFEIIAAVIIGLLIFGTLPDMLACFGIVLIIISGTVVKRLPGALKLRRREKF